MNHENIIIDWSLIQDLSSFTLQQIAREVIEILKDRNDLSTLKVIDDRIPIQSFSDERIGRLDTKDRVKFIEGMYDDCSVFEQRDIADYTCDMASQERLRELIDWRGRQKVMQQENESYRMERTLSVPQI